MRDCVSRLFVVRMKLGEFDPSHMNPYTKYDYAISSSLCLQCDKLAIFYRLKIADYIQSKEHIQLSHDMAVQTMVLLKNDQSNGLPITSPYQKACVSDTVTCRTRLSVTVCVTIVYTQVVGPFIDDPKLLFGDYTPDVMVLHSSLWCAC